MIALGATAIDDAKGLLSYVPFVWGLLTAGLLAPAWRWSSENEKFHLGHSVAAVVMSVVSAVVGATVAAVLAPPGVRVLKADQATDGIFVFYALFFLAVVAATAWSLVVVVKATRHLQLVVRK